jgi:hypothetical protein
MGQREKSLRDRAGSGGYLELRTDWTKGTLGTQGMTAAKLEAVLEGRKACNKGS